MNRNVALIALVAAAPLAHAEGFEDVAGLFSGGTWAQQNLSNPSDTTNANPWGQGDPTQFIAASGPDDSYIAANYTAAGDANTDTGTISAWLFAPTQTFNNGDAVNFMTRTASGSINPDRLQVRFSANGASTNVGADENSVGDFSTLLLDLNPDLVQSGYPSGWQAYSISLAGLTGATSGRIGFRYLVSDSGPGGVNGNLVGLDSYSVQAVPEPATMAALGLGLAAFARRRSSAK